MVQYKTATNYLKTFRRVSVGSTQSIQRRGIESVLLKYGNRSFHRPGIRTYLTVRTKQIAREKEKDHG